MDQAGDGSDAAAGEKAKGLFGRVFSGGDKRYKAAKMGNELEMYYNEKVNVIPNCNCNLKCYKTQFLLLFAIPSFSFTYHHHFTSMQLKCWVLPGEEEAKEKEVAELKAPPPKSMSYAPSSTQEDAGSAASNGNGNKPPGGFGGTSIYGGARGTSRYASASSFSISTAENGGGGAAPSLLSGLKPASPFGCLPGGASATPAVFKPMVPAPTAIQEEEATSPGIVPVAEEKERRNNQQEDTGNAAGESLEYDNNQYYNDTQQQQQQHFYQNNDSTNSATAAPVLNAHQIQNPPSSSSQSAISDPVILEVLSFWSYYRNCGYDTDAMAEWVGQNYEPEYSTLNIDYEEMLLNPDVLAAVEQHISENKNTDAPDGGVAVVAAEAAAATNNGGSTVNEMMLEDASLAAEHAGEYIPPPTSQFDSQQRYAYKGEEATAAGGGTHLPGAESGWSGYDDGLEIEGGTGTATGADKDMHAASDLPTEFGGGDGIDDYAVAAPAPAGGDGNVVDPSYMQYDQYKQYHTTDQYFVEETQTQAQAADGGALGEEGGEGGAYHIPPQPFPTTTSATTEEQDPTLGQVLGNMFHQHSSQQTAVTDGTGIAGHVVHTIGETLIKDLLDDGVNIGTTMDQQERESDEQMLPLQEDQWGYTTPAAGPSPARGSNGHGGGDAAAGAGGHLRFPLPIPGGQQQHLSTNNDGGIAGVHPIFSPGQLAADLGVPREAVSMSALFAAEAASVGTLSSQESEDGWSDGGDVVGIVPGVYESGGDGSRGAEGAAMEGEEVEKKQEESASMVLQQQQLPESQPVVGANATTTVSSSHIDVVDPWEAAAAAIEATARGTGADIPPSSSQIEHLPTAPLPADASAPVVEMEESKSTQAGTFVDGSGAGVDDSQYRAALLKVESLHEELQVATATAETATADLERSKEEAAVQSATLAEAMGARDAAIHEMRALEIQIENLKSEAARVPALLEKCSTLEIAAAEQQASSLADFESRLALLAEERNDLAAKLEEAQAQDASAAATTAGELAVLQLNLEEVKEALEARENECEDLKAALELKDDAIVELRNEKMKADEATKEEIASIESRLESQVASIRGELSAAREALAATEKSASDNIAAALKDVHERIQIAAAEAVEEKNAELERLETAWLEEKTQHASQISSIESVVTEKESEIMELRAQLTTQRAETEAAAAANLAAAIAEISASKEAELKAAQTRIKDLEKKFALAKKKIAGQISQQEQSTAEIENLKAQLEGASTSHDAELSEMARALEEAVAAQQALTTKASALQSRVEQLQATKEEEIQSLAADNTQIVQMIGQRDSFIESLDTTIKQLQAELEAAKEDITQWEAVAEDADARCTAAEEALANEKAAREEASNAVVHLQEDMALLNQALASTEAQCNELVAMQEQARMSGKDEGRDFDNATEHHHQQQQRHNAEILALRQRISELESTLTVANQTLHTLDRGGFEDAVEEVGELRTRLAAASQVAAAKEEELLKYKKQLVKAKKLRTADLEKIAAFEKQQHSTAGGGGGGGGEDDHNNDSNSSTAFEISSLREEVSSLQEQLTALRAASVETDEGLNDALSALGIEESKVARLAELLVEKGVEKKVLEEELNAVEERMVMMDDEEEKGGGVQEVSPEGEEESFV